MADQNDDNQNKNDLEQENIGQDPLDKAIQEQEAALQALKNDDAIEAARIARNTRIEGTKVSADVAGTDTVEHHIEPAGQGIKDPEVINQTEDHNKREFLASTDAVDGVITSASKSTTQQALEEEKEKKNMKTATAVQIANATVAEIQQTFDEIKAAQETQRVELVRLAEEAELSEERVGQLAVDIQDKIDVLNEDPDTTQQRIDNEESRKFVNVDNLKTLQDQKNNPEMASLQAKTLGELQTKLTETSETTSKNIKDLEARQEDIATKMAELQKGDLSKNGDAIKQLESEQEQIGKDLKLEQENLERTKALTEYTDNLNTKNATGDIAMSTEHRLGINRAARQALDFAKDGAINQSEAQDLRDSVKGVSGDYYYAQDKIDELADKIAPSGEITYTDKNGITHHGKEGFEAMKAELKESAADRSGMPDAVNDNAAFVKHMQARQETLERMDQEGMTEAETKLAEEKARTYPNADKIAALTEEVRSERADAVMRGTSETIAKLEQEEARERANPDRIKELTAEAKAEKLDELQQKVNTAENALDLAKRTQSIDNIEKRTLDLNDAKARLQETQELFKEPETGNEATASKEDGTSEGDTSGKTDHNQEPDDLANAGAAGVLAGTTGVAPPPAPDQLDTKETDARDAVARQVEGGEITRDQLAEIKTDANLSDGQMAKLEADVEGQNIKINETEGDTMQREGIVAAADGVTGSPENSAAIGAVVTAAIPILGVSALQVSTIEKTTTSDNRCSGIDNGCFADSEAFTKYDNGDASYNNHGKPTLLAQQIQNGNVPSDLTLSQNKAADGDATSGSGDGGGPEHDLEQQLKQQAEHALAMEKLNEINRPDMTNDPKMVS